MKDDTTGTAKETVQVIDIEALHKAGNTNIIPEAMFMNDVISGGLEKDENGAITIDLNKEYETVVDSSRGPQREAEAVEDMLGSVFNLPGQIGGYGNTPMYSIEGDKVTITPEGIERMTEVAQKTYPMQKVPVAEYKQETGVATGRAGEKYDNLARQFMIDALPEGAFKYADGADELIKLSNVVKDHIENGGKEEDIAKAIKDSIVISDNKVIGKDGEEKLEFHVKADDLQHALDNPKAKEAEIGVQEGKGKTTQAKSEPDVSAKTKSSSKGLGGLLKKAVKAVTDLVESVADAVGVGGSKTPKDFTIERNYEAEASRDSTFSQAAENARQQPEVKHLGSKTNPVAHLDADQKTSTTLDIQEEVLDGTNRKNSTPQKTGLVDVGEGMSKERIEAIQREVKSRENNRQAGLQGIEGLSDVTANLQSALNGETLAQTQGQQTSKVEGAQLDGSQKDNAKAAKAIKEMTGKEATKEQLAVTSSKDSHASKTQEQGQGKSAALGA